MKFTLVSDLHLDFRSQPRVNYEEFEDTVVLAGDTSNGLACLEYFDKLRSKGKTIVAVDGNHEHYANRNRKRTVQETEDAFFANVERRQIIDGVHFVSACGWYTVTDDVYWRNYMNDSHHGNTNYLEVNQKCFDHAELIENELQEWKLHGIRGVVVTHMAPCTDTLDPNFKGEFSNQWYWSHRLRYLISDYADQIAVWCHGHTHHANEAIVDGVRVVCNPRGYPGQNKTWKPITIEV